MNTGEHEPQDVYQVTIYIIVNYGRILIASDSSDFATRLRWNIGTVNAGPHISLKKTHLFTTRLQVRYCFFRSQL